MFIPLRDDAPRRRFPHATVGLIALNIAVFIVQSSVPAGMDVQLLYAAGAVPREIAQFADIVDGQLHPPDLVPPPLTILSSMFLHGGVEHLVGNVWFLWIFGDNVEDAMGPWRFLAFYFAVGILAAATQVVMTPSSLVPMVGASGAIAGVLGAYLLYYPRARVKIVLFILVVVQVVSVPAFVALGIWLLWQLCADPGDGSIAIWAHVGGFLLGLVLGKLFVAPQAASPRVASPLAPPWTLHATESSSSPR